MAPFYDVFSGEWPVYRSGRVAAVEELRPRRGATVLDLGCGTGLNFPLLLPHVTRSARLVGVDSSEHMLAQARRRATRLGWHNVELVCADATTVSADRLGGGFDAVLATYALSLMSHWEDAWQRAVEVTRQGGRLAVVDMRRPVGRAAWLTPLARLACALGGADIDAHPWRAVERACADVVARSLRGGHVQVRVGTRT